MLTEDAHSPVYEGYFMTNNASRHAFIGAKMDQIRRASDLQTHAKEQGLPGDTLKQKAR